MEEVDYVKAKISKTYYSYVVSINKSLKNEKLLKRNRLVYLQILNFMQILKTVLGSKMKPITMIYTESFDELELSIKSHCSPIGNQEH